MCFPHLCYVQDAIHGWLPSLPFHRNKVSIKTGQVKRDQADHGQPQQEHVASFPGLERNGQTKGFYFIFCNMKCREHKLPFGSKGFSKMSKRKLPMWVAWNSRGDTTTSPPPKLQNCNNINGPSPLNQKSRHPCLLPTGKLHLPIFPFLSSLTSSAPLHTNITEGCFSP